MGNLTFVTYVKDALSPGGTPTRYLLWVSIILICQALASVLPSPQFYVPDLNLAHVLLGVIVIIALGVQFLRSDRQKIMAAYVLYIVGLALSTITISVGITSLSGIVFMLTWAMTLFVAERREYISFDLVTLFMVLMLASTIVLLLFNPSMGVSNNITILAVGAIFTAINIYLVYADFGFERNFYQASRKTYTNLEELSAILSDILSSKGELQDLLWRVTEECVPFLELEECVIYLYDEKKDRLVQVAAFGSKSSEDHTVLVPIEITPGQGIVGTVFKSGVLLNVEETRRHKDYIVDDKRRNSELAVPIVSNGNIIGVIDSEHTKSGFFAQRHEQAFQIIAAFCGIKIVEFKATQFIRQAEQAKIEATRYKELELVKNRFITNISHDLKTPLSLIKAPAMQITKISDDEQVQKHANYILKNTEHLLRVVGQLLQLNRVDKGLNELYIDEVMLDVLIQKLGQQYSGLAEKDDIQFIFHSAPLKVMTDSFRLEQILHNLVHNAFRYTGKKGKIELLAVQVNDRLNISISDNGPGISPDLQEKVFERFYKVDENNHEGTGIGLSLVREYVHSLLGTIQIESENGKGTRFTVSIPNTHGTSESIEPAPNETKPDLGIDGKPVLLVVEDHADLNEFICTFFEDDFQCISAFDGEEALEKMAQQIPDILISDLMMPNMDGNTFIQILKRNEDYGHIPIVVLSAKSQTESRIDLYNIGADNYLMKPFDIAELSAVVKNLLEQRQKLKHTFHRNFLSGKNDRTHDPLSVGKKENAALIAEAMQSILEHLDDSEFGVRILAQELGIPRNRFQTELKELTGLSPVEFIRSVRLNEAKKMLQEKTLNVSEIAYSVGFNNLSYFTRSFKSEFGILPSQW
ncbi:MAG: hypothetical protein A3D92_08185 [Bacteroidetes bacterium RIFCSPHIGHO2_02_FULL_44_7]|nr:MAG: hypothetical protein A3D92_08185 [Bacteroidetes bacterium RIFCSPHIGHO2_02_FULL_44_7]